jgi:tape measure domain-containing protein
VVLDVGSVQWTAKLDVTQFNQQVAEMKKVLQKIDTTIKLDTKKITPPILKTKLAVDDTAFNKTLSDIQKQDNEITINTKRNETIEQPRLETNIGNPAVDLSTIMAQYEALNNKVILPVVDHKPLEELNKHLDLKQQHWDNLNGHMAKKPLRPNTDNGGAGVTLQDLESELSDAKNKFEIPIALTQEIEVKPLERIDKEVKSLTQVDAIADIVAELSEPDLLTADNEKNTKPKEEAKKEDKKILASSMLVPTVVTGVMKKELTMFFNTQHKLSARQLNVIGFFQKAVNSFGISSDKFAKANRSSLFGSIWKGVTGYIGQSLGEYLILKMGPKLAEKGAEVLLGEKANGIAKKIVPRIAERGTETLIAEKLPTKQLEGLLLGSFTMGRSLEALTGSLAEQNGMFSSFFSTANKHLSKLDSVLFSTYREVKTAELIHHTLKELKRVIIQGTAVTFGRAIGKSLVGTANKIVTSPAKMFAGALSQAGSLFANLTIIPFKKTYDRVLGGKTNQEKQDQGSRLGFIAASVTKSFPVLATKVKEKAINYTQTDPLGVFIASQWGRMNKFREQAFGQGAPHPLFGQRRQNTVDPTGKLGSIFTRAGQTNLFDKMLKFSEKIAGISFKDLFKQVEKDTPITTEDILQNILLELKQTNTLLSDQGIVGTTENENNLISGQGIIGTTENENNLNNPLAENNIPLVAPITAKTIGMALIPIVNLLRQKGGGRVGEKTAVEGGISLLNASLDLGLDFKQGNKAKPVNTVRSELQDIISNLTEADDFEKLNGIASFLVKNWEKLALDRHKDYAPDLSGGVTSTRLKSSNVNSEGLEESAEETSGKWAEAGDDIVATLNRLLAVSENVGDNLTHNIAENSPGPTEKIRKHWLKTADYLIKQMIRLVAPSKKIGGFLAKSFSDAFVNIGKIVTDIEARIKGIKFNNLADASKSLLGSFTDSIGNKANAIKNKIGENATAVKEDITNKIELPELPDFEGIKGEINTKLDILKSFDLNSVLSKTIKQISLSINKLFTGINTELQKIEFKKPLLVINKTLQSFYGHIITQVKSYKAIFKSFSDSLTISENVTTESKQVATKNIIEENVKENTQDESKETKVNSFDINSVLSKTIKQISLSINKLFTGINTELQKIEFKKPLLVINKTLQSFYGHIITQVKSYKAIFKSFSDSLTISENVTTESKQVATKNIIEENVKENTQDESKETKVNSFDINSVLSKTIKQISLSINKLFTGINTELQKIEFKKPLLVINKTLQSFYGHIITQIKSYKAIFKSLNDSLTIPESVDNKTTKINDETIVSEDNQDKSTVVKRNSFDLNSVFSTAINKMNEAIDKLFSGINTELQKIKYQESLNVVHKTLVTFYGFVISQIRKYKIFFKSFIDSIDLANAITQNKTTIKENIDEFQTLVSINIVELFRNINNILEKITNPLTEIMAISDEIYSNLIEIKAKMSALATKISTFDFSFENVIETSAKNLNIAFKDSDKSWARIVKLLTKSSYIFIKQGSLLLGPVLFNVIKEVAITLADTISEELANLEDKFKIMDKLNNNTFIVTLIKNINKTILFFTKSVAGIRSGIETSTTLFSGIFTLLEDKVQTTGEIINKSLQGLSNLFNNLKEKLNSIPFLKSKEKSIDTQNIDFSNPDNDSPALSEKGEYKTGKDDTKQEEIYFRKLFVALNKAILSLDRKGTRNIAKIAEVPLTSIQSNSDLLPLLIDKIELNPASLKGVIAEIESEWDAINLNGGENPFAELHSEIENIDDRWGETGNYFKKVVREMSKVSKTEGYKILHNLAEGSPGLTQDIRNRWKETTKSVGVSMQGMTKESERSFRNLTDVLNGVKITGLDFGNDLANNLKAKLGNFADDMIDRGEVKLYDLLGINLKDTADVDKAIEKLNTGFNRLKIMGATDVDSVINSFGGVLNRRENASFKQVRQEIKEMSAIKKEIAAKLATPPAFKQQDGTLDKRAIVKYFQEVEKLMYRYKVTLGNLTQNFKVNPNVQKALNTLPVEARRNLNSFIVDATKGFNDFETMADSFQDSMVNILNLDSESLRNLKVPESVIAQIEKLALVGKEARVALDFDNFQMPTFEENKQQATRTLVNIYDKKATVDDIQSSRTENVANKTNFITDIKSVKAKYDSDYKRLIAQNKITEAKTLEDGYKSYLKMRAKQLQDIKNVESKYKKELGEVAILLGDFDTEAQVAEYLRGFDTLTDGLDSLAEKIQIANEELKQSTIETANSITSNLSIYEASTQEILAIENKLQSIGKKKENVENRYTKLKNQAKAKERQDLNEIIRLEQRRLAEISNLESAESKLTTSLGEQKNIKETSRKKVFEIQQSGSLADINSIYETEVPVIEPDTVSAFDKFKTVLTEMKKLAGTVFTSLGNQLDNLKSKYPFLQSLENVFKRIGLQIGVLAFVAPIGLNLLGKAITATVQATVQKVQELFRTTFQAALDFESQTNQFRFTFGQVTGITQLEQIRKQTDKLGQSVKTTTQQFAQFALGLQGVQMEDSALPMFEGIQKGLTVRGVNAEGTSRALVALTQIANKGKVSMEELNGQLGEALPGALPLAARAMNMTTTQLMSEVAAGKIFSDEFLPKFTTQMNKEADPFMEGALDTGAVKLTQLENAIENLKIALGSGMIDFTKPLITGVTAAINLFIQFTEEIVKAGIALTTLFFAPVIEATIRVALTNIMSAFALFMNNLKLLWFDFRISTEAGLTSLQASSFGLFANIAKGAKGLFTTLTTLVNSFKVTLMKFLPLIPIMMVVDFVSNLFTRLEATKDLAAQATAGLERMEKATRELAKTQKAEQDKKDGKNPEKDEEGNTNIDRGWFGNMFAWMDGNKKDNIGRGWFGQASQKETDSIGQAIVLQRSFDKTIKEYELVIRYEQNNGGQKEYLEKAGKLNADILANAITIAGLKDSGLPNSNETMGKLKKENQIKTAELTALNKQFYPTSYQDILTNLENQKLFVDEKVKSGTDFGGTFAIVSAELDKIIPEIKKKIEDMNDALQDSSTGMLTLTQTLSRFASRVEASKFLLQKEITQDKKGIVGNQLSTGYSDALSYQRKNAELELTNAQKETKRLEAEYTESTKIINETTDKRATDSLLTLFGALGDNVTKLTDAKLSTLNDVEKKAPEGTQDVIVALKRRQENRNEYENSKLQELTSQLALKDLGKQQFVDMRGFLRSLQDLDITVRDYFRDRARSLYDMRIRLEDASIQNQRGERDLVESYQDLITSLKTQLLTTANEITKITSELTRRTSINKLRAGLEFGQKGFLADFITLFEGIQTSETDVRNETLTLDEQRLAIATEMVGIAKQIRGLEEQVFDLARQRTAQEIELTRQFDDFQQSQTLAWRGIRNQSDDMVLQANTMGVNFKGIADSIGNINANYVDIHNNISKLAESVKQSVEQYQGQMESGGSYTGSGDGSSVGNFTFDRKLKVDPVKGAVDKVTTVAQREAFIIHILTTKYGMTLEQASAWAGTARKESTNDPYNVNSSSKATGLYQQTSTGGRKEAMLAYAPMTGFIFDDIEKQIDFAMKESKEMQGFKNLDDFKQQKTLSAMVNHILNNFLRPSMKERAFPEYQTYSQEALINAKARSANPPVTNTTNNQAKPTVNGKASGDNNNSSRNANRDKTTPIITSPTYTLTGMDLFRTKLAGQDNKNGQGLLGIASSIIRSQQSKSEANGVSEAALNKVLQVIYDKTTNKIVEVKIDKSAFIAMKDGEKKNTVRWFLEDTGFLKDLGDKDTKNISHKDFNSNTTTDTGRIKLVEERIKEAQKYNNNPTSPYHKIATPFVEQKRQTTPVITPQSKSKPTDSFIKEQPNNTFTKADIDRLTKENRNPLKNITGIFDQQKKDRDLLFEAIEKKLLEIKYDEKNNYDYLWKNLDIYNEENLKYGEVYEKYRGDKLAPFLFPNKNKQNNQSNLPQSNLPTSNLIASNFNPNVVSDMGGILPRQQQLPDLKLDTKAMNWLNQGIDINKPKDGIDLNFPASELMAQAVKTLPVLNKRNSNNQKSILINAGHQEPNGGGTNGTANGFNLNGRTLESVALEILAPILVEQLKNLGVPTQLFKSKETDRIKRSENFINQANKSNAFPLEIHLDANNGENGVIIGEKGKRNPLTNALQDEYGLNKFDSTRKDLTIPTRGGTLLELSAMDKEVSDMFLRAIKSGDFTEITKWSKQFAVGIKEAYNNVQAQNTNNKPVANNNQNKIVPVSIVAGPKDGTKYQGTASGPHLHLAAQRNGSYFNPKEYEKYIYANGKPLTSMRPSSDYGPRDTGIPGASTNHKGRDFGLLEGTVLSVDTSRLKPVDFGVAGGYGGVSYFEDLLTGVIVKFAHQSPKSQQLMNQAGAGGLNLPNVNGINGIQGGQTKWNQISKIGYNPSMVSQPGDAVLDFVDANSIIEQLVKEQKFSDNKEGVDQLAKLIRLKDEGRFNELLQEAQLLGIDLEQLKVYKNQLEALNQIQKQKSTQLENEAKLFDYATQIFDATRQAEDTFYGLNTQVKEFSLNAKGYLTFAEDATRQFDELTNKVRDMKRGLENFRLTIDTNLGFTDKDLSPEERVKKEEEAINNIKAEVEKAKNEGKITEEAGGRLLGVINDKTIPAREKLKLIREEISLLEQKVELGEKINLQSLAYKINYEQTLEKVKGLSDYLKQIAEYENKKNPLDMSGLFQSAVLEEQIRQLEMMKSFDDFMKEFEGTPEKIKELEALRSKLQEINKEKLSDITFEATLFSKALNEPFKNALGESLDTLMTGQKSFNDIAKDFLESIRKFFLNMSVEMIHNQAMKWIKGKFFKGLLPENIGQDEKSKSLLSSEDTPDINELVRVNNTLNLMLEALNRQSGAGVSEQYSDIGKGGMPTLYNPNSEIGIYNPYANLENATFSEDMKIDFTDATNVLTAGLSSSFGDIDAILTDTQVALQQGLISLVTMISSGGSSQGGGGFLGKLIGTGLNMAVGAIGGGVGLDLSGASTFGDFASPAGIDFSTGSFSPDLKAFKEGGQIKTQDIPNFKEGGIITEKIPKILNFMTGGEVKPEMIPNFKEGGSIGQKIPKLDTFAKGGSVKNKLESMVNLSLGISKAMKKEGANALPIVVSLNEQVLSQKNGDADFYRYLEKSGEWESLKTDYKYNRNIPNYLNGGSIGNPTTNTMNKSNSNMVVNNNSYVTVKATDVNSFRKSASLIAQEQKIAQTKDNRYT